MSRQSVFVKPLPISLMGLLLVLLGVNYFTQTPTVLVNNNSPANSHSHVTHKEFNSNKTQVSDSPVVHIIKDISFDNYQSQFGPLAKSLKNTYIPVHFTVTPDGQLVVTRSIRSLIEYFLSANTEESIDTIIARINEIFDTVLGQPARSQAKGVLRQYLDYKQALVTIEQQQADEQNLSGNVPSYESALQYRKDARKKYLGQEIYDAFYAKDDNLDDYTTGMLAINKNHDLSDEQKQQQALELERLLPLEEQAIKNAEHQREELQNNISKARAEGASESQIFQMRSQFYDQKTAERFAVRDIQKAEWDTRFNQYRQQRQTILNGDGMSDDDKVQQIKSLQHELFDNREQLRISTLDRIADQKVQ